MWTVAPWWHWLSMAAFWLVLVLVAIWATTRLFPAGDPPPSARALLDERLARGELDVDEYRRLRHELTSPRQERPT
jgi:putative membrane protein